MEVSVRDLKSRLSEYLRRVAAGESIVVTSHRKAVARLLPPPSQKVSASEEAELIARFRSLPWVRSGRDKRPPLPKPAVRMGTRTLTQIVSEQRG